jgi:hypothetical protein
VNWKEFLKGIEMFCLNTVGIRPISKKIRAPVIYRSNDRNMPSGILYYGIGYWGFITTTELQIAKRKKTFAMGSGH